MQTFILVREAIEVNTDHTGIGRPGDTWPVSRPLTVRHFYYGDNITMEIDTHYPGGAVPVADLETGGTFRVTIERIEEGQS